MSRTARRICSWLAVLAVAAGIFVVIRHLPGAGGLAEEVRWLLRRGTPGDFNQAAQLLTIANAKNPGTTVHVFRSLLFTEKDANLKNTLKLLADRIAMRYGGGCTPSFAEEPVECAELFFSWFQSKSEANKLSLLVDLGPVLFEAANWNNLYSSEATRWCFVASMSLKMRLRAWGEATFRGVGDEIIVQRLRVLDGVPPFPADEYLKPIPQEIGSWEFLDANYALGDEVTILLQDKFAPVRWSAGRILAVCKDPRGLSAVYEWLQNDPNAPQSANKILDELFGSDWRKPFEQAGRRVEP